MSVNLERILNFFENDFSRLNRQYEWDNSGRQVVVSSAPVARVALSLDPTKGVIQEAVNKGCELLITHHPIFFGSFKNIDIRDAVSEKVVYAIKNNLNIVSYHTNLDLGEDGLNNYISKIMDVESSEGFISEGEEKYYKFAVFVPTGYENKILSAIEFSGGGQIGRYKKCTFQTSGTGTFEPTKGTNPFIGEVGKTEEVSEIKIETVVNETKLTDLIANVIKAHPYEEVAYDVYPLAISKKYFLGKICTLKEAMNANDFFEYISKKLGIKDLKYNFTRSDTEIKKFAVVTGGGASLWRHCLTKGVNVLLTGDMKHHDAIDAQENGVLIVDAGHFSTERIYMNYLKKIISSNFDVEVFLMEEEDSLKYWRNNDA